MKSSEKIIEYFIRNHYFSNFILFVVLIGGFMAWQVTEKEARPNIAFDTIQVTTRYPGASPEVTEHFIARPLENNLRGIQGVDEISSTCTSTTCSTRIQLEPAYPDKDVAKSEIRNAVLATAFPSEVTDIDNNPLIREHKTANIPLIDVGLIFTDKSKLTKQSRIELQSHALTLENQVLSLPQISEVQRQGYLNKEIQIIVNPAKLIQNEISFTEIIDSIRSNSVKQPGGSLRGKDETLVSIEAELKDVNKLQNLIIQGSFSGSGFVRLKHIAKVQETFEENKSIFKINGHEAVSLSLVKSQGYDILKTRRIVFDAIERFRNENLKGKSIDIVFIDDESRHIRNRLSIISINGLLGFTLILLVLFLFLDLRTGFWVAMGIPFTLGFTFLLLPFFGYSINNITLAGVIIVMGMVVDDAIIVAENINRSFERGMSHMDACVKGTSYMFLPINASILTTCFAFSPLFFLPGRMGKFVEILPVIIISMLAASLFESLFILPGHLSLRRKKRVSKLSLESQNGNGWFNRLEDKYEKTLSKSLKKKQYIIIGFIVVMVSLFAMGALHLKFAMFPREESTEFFITGKANENARRHETAKQVKQVENILKPYLDNEVMSYMTRIGKSRRGSTIEENKFTIVIEIPYRHDRDRPAKEMFAEWEENFKKLKNLHDVRIVKRRFGSTTGSPIEIAVQSNDDSAREKIVVEMMKHMKQHPALRSIERENSVLGNEFHVDFKRDNLTRLSVDPGKIAPTLRASLAGVIATRHYEGDEEIAVRVIADSSSSSSIAKLMNIPVENRGQYLVPLSRLIEVKNRKVPTTIKRKDFRRTETIYADIEINNDITPLEIADYFEENVFPSIRTKYPQAVIYFSGEVEESRETQGYLKYILYAVILLIYSVLVLLLKSLSKPIIIMVVIPFAIAGVILTLFSHGIGTYGFMTIIGSIGLCGVVVNDSIVMVNKLEKEKINPATVALSKEDFIASTAKTRLRAIVLTTLTTAAGLLPTAYGIGGYDGFLSDMMLIMAWGLIFATGITLFLIPALYSLWSNPTIGKSFNEDFEGENINTNYIENEDLINENNYLKQKLQSLTRKRTRTAKKKSNKKT